MSIKKYNSFLKESEIPLALPPHIPNKKEKVESIGDSIFRYTISQLYKMEHNDIILTSSRINSIMEDGTYIKMRDKKYNIIHLSQNEPMMIFPVRGNNIFSVGSHKNVKVEDDSLIIWSKPYDSLFVLSSKEFDNIEITFVRPKRVISKHDPYGEEDWEDDVYESVETEEIIMNKSIEEIFDNLLTYDRVCDYLKDELIGKEVNFYTNYYNPVKKVNYNHNRLKKKVVGIIDDVILDEDSLIFFLVINNKKFEVNTQESMKWSKTLNRVFTEQDPYGED